MNITALFFVSVLISFLGVLPPGMLNMSAAKISLKEGHNRAFVFSFGVCIIVCFQTFIATIFAKYLSENPNMTAILKRVATVIFVLISIYFFARANQNPSVVAVSDHTKSKQSRFFQGLLLSALNIFPVPFQAYVVTSFLSVGWLTNDGLSIGTYITGAGTGTFIALYIYVLFFDKLKNTKLTTPKNMNYAIGTITLLVAIVSFINLIHS